MWLKHKSFSDFYSEFMPVSGQIIDTHLIDIHKIPINLIEFLYDHPSVQSTPHIIDNKTNKSPKITIC